MPVQEVIFPGINGGQKTMFCGDWLGIGGIWRQSVTNGVKHYLRNVGNNWEENFWSWLQRQRHPEFDLGAYDSFLELAVDSFLPKSWVRNSHNSWRLEMSAIPGAKRYRRNLHAPDFILVDSACQETAGKMFLEVQGRAFHSRDEETAIRRAFHPYPVFFLREGDFVRDPTEMLWEVLAWESRRREEVRDLPSASSLMDLFVRGEMQKQQILEAVRLRFAEKGV